MSSTINPTTLATSLPRNLARGFAFLPANTSLENPAVPQFIGFDGSEPDFGQDLLNLRIPILLFRLRSRVNARFIAAAFIGYNLQYTVVGGINSNLRSEGILRVNGDAAEGGAGFGLGWDVIFTFALDRGFIRFTWRSGFRTTWEEVFSLTADASIDLVGAAVAALEKAGFNIGLSKLRDFAGVRSIWGLYDRASNQMARLGYLELKPKVALHGNLLDAAAAVSTKFKAFYKAVKAVGIKPSAGPVLNIYFPVRMTLVRLGTEYGSYDLRDPRLNDQFLGEPSVFYRLVPVGNTNAPIGSPPVQDVSMIHTHTIDIKVGLAIKIKIKLWSVFSQEVNIPIDLTEFLPALRLSTVQGAPLLGPYFNQLRARGGTTAAELPEVIWG